MFSFSRLHSKKLYLMIFNTIKDVTVSIWNENRSAWAFKLRLTKSQAGSVTIPVICLILHTSGMCPKGNYNTSRLVTKIDSIVYGYPVPWLIFAVYRTSYLAASSVFVLLTVICCIGFHQTLLCSVQEDAEVMLHELWQQTHNTAFQWLLNLSCHEMVS